MNKSGCMLCPRKCGVDRTDNMGYCGSPQEIRIARASLHMWEEPVISGENGSGTIFFSGCNLRCCFCQNYTISAQNFGVGISEERLGEIMFELKEKGAHNINLVTPTHYADKIANVLSRVKERLDIPVVYNTSGYENAETIEMFDGLVDIYMPDIKYFSPDMSKRYSAAADYFEKASIAIKKMYEQVGAVEIGRDEMMKKGVLIRHMIMPGAYKDSVKILEWISANFDTDALFVSIMNQYTPIHKSEKYPEINRRVTTYEYNKVTECAERLGIRGFAQEKNASSTQYIPDFNLEGVLKKG